MLDVVADQVVYITVDDRYRSNGAGTLTFELAPLAPL